MVNEDTTITLTLPSMTLDKSAIRDLGRIVEKANVDHGKYEAEFIIMKGRDSVRATNLDRFMEARWPGDIRAVELEGNDEEHLLKISLRPYSSTNNEVIISSSDSKWVTIIEKNIDDFVREHRNWHWIVTNQGMATFLVIMISLASGFGISLALNLSWPFLIMPIFISFMCFFYIAIGLLQVYPHVMIRAGVKVPKDTLRSCVNYIIPGILLGVVVNLVWQFFLSILSR